MPRTYSLIAAATVVFLLFGCAARPPVPSTGGYSLVHQGRTFRIESYSPPGMIGYNQLVLRDEGRVVFMGLDRDQNGSLDEVVVGTIPLEEAIRIYSRGLLIGIREGMVRNTTWQNDFSVIIDRRTCVVTTFVLAAGEMYNKLTVLNTDIGLEEAVVVDLGADGSLDLVERGERGRAYYQSLYLLVLERGLDAGRINRSEGTYLIIP